MKKSITFTLLAALLLSLSACGGEEAAAPADLQGLYESYAAQLPDMFLPDEDTMMNFLGIDTADCTRYVVSICGDGMRADEVWLIEAKDDASLKRLRELAETRIQAKLDETESYAPDQYAVVQKAELLTKGKYLALLISPEVDVLKAGFEAAVS